MSFHSTVGREIQEIHIVPNDDRMLACWFSHLLERHQIGIEPLQFAIELVEAPPVIGVPYVKCCDAQIHVLSRTRGVDEIDARAL